jgi:hypothetical protein
MGLSPALASPEVPVLPVSATTLELGGPEAASRFNGCVPGDGHDGGCANNIGFVSSASVSGGTGRG